VSRWTSRRETTRRTTVICTNVHCWPRVRDKQLRLQQHQSVCIRQLRALSYLFYERTLLCVKVILLLTTTTKESMTTTTMTYVLRENPKSQSRVVSREPILLCSHESLPMTLRERNQDHSHEFLVIQFLCFSCHSPSSRGKDILNYVTCSFQMGVGGGERMLPSGTSLRK
jgi:hypothetical protein